MSKNFDETVRLQSEQRQEWIREIKGERLQGITEDASSAPRLASSSSVSFPGSNECPGTHCSLIEQKEREDSSCQICHRVWDKRKDGGEDRVVRTKRESDNMRREEKWQTCWYCRGQKRACRRCAGFGGKTGTYWACRKGRSGLSATERAVGKNAGAALAKNKRNRAVCPDYQIMRGERVKMGESRTLTRVREIRARAWKGKGGIPVERRQIPRRKGRASNKSFPRRSRRKHEWTQKRVSGCKSSPGRFAESWFHSKSGQT